MQTGTLEHLSHTFDACHEGVNLLFRVVQGKRCTDSALYSKTRHERLGAMVACAHSNAQAIEQGSDVKMMDVAHVE